MGIRSVEVKSILQASKLPGAKYVINPYSGCVHGCVYCYARFMKRFTGHLEPWGTYLDARINAPEILRKQLSRRKEPLRETVFLSSVTDLYQPPEAQFRLTRQILAVLLEYQIPISILTKSDLVLRDIDLLSQFEDCSVGLSIQSTDDELARRLEPRATPPSRRLQALRTLREKGIDTYAFISPFLPGLSDLRSLLEALSGVVEEAGIEAINMRGGNWTGVEQMLRRYYPEKAAECERLSRDENYWSNLEREARDLGKHFQIEVSGFYRH